MNDIQRIYKEMCEHGAEIRRLAGELEKRYGIHICSFDSLDRNMWDDSGDYIKDYFKVLLFTGYGNFVQALGFSRDDIYSTSRCHWHVVDRKSGVVDAVEIATVSKTAAKRFRPAERRDNKWTRLLKEGERDEG